MDRTKSNAALKDTNAALGDVLLALGEAMRHGSDLSMEHMQTLYRALKYGTENCRRAIEIREEELKGAEEKGVTIQGEE